MFAIFLDQIRLNTDFPFFYIENKLWFYTPIPPIFFANSLTFEISAEKLDVETTNHAAEENRHMV